ncbi:MAG: hypothetical protein U0556_01500 [Dehalococcoidia bacterium]
MISAQPRPTAVTSAAQSFERAAGVCAVLAGGVSLAYSVAFVVLQNAGLSAAMLLAAGLLSTAVVVGLYGRLRRADDLGAIWVLALGLVGAAGSAVHGAYDLANAINPPDANLLSLASLPNQVDPRGLLAFGVTGIAMLGAGALARGGALPRGLAWLTVLLGVLLVMIYLGRLIVLTASSPIILIPAVLAGLVVNPVWNVWLGLNLLRGR